VLLCPRFLARLAQNFLPQIIITNCDRVLISDYTKGDTVLIDADGAGLLFGRKSVMEGKEVVTKRLAGV
jgi:hypothetical protein